MPQARRDPGALLAVCGVVGGIALLSFGSLARLSPSAGQTVETVRLQERAIATGPGGVVTSTLALNNSIPGHQSFNVSVTGQRWTVTFPSRVTVPANAILEVPIAVSVPFEVDGIGQDSATVTFTPRGGGNPLTAQLDSTTAGKLSAAGYFGCRFDLDRDGDIRAADAAVAAARFAISVSQEAPDVMLDFNHDGRIGAADIQAVAGRAGQACPDLPSADTTAIRDAMTVEGVRRHLDALQAIATANGGNRAALKPGYDASAAYVKDQLATAGYSVTVQTFTVPQLEQLSPSTLSRIAPLPKVYTPTIEFSTFLVSGNITARLQAVDLVIPPGTEIDTSTSGCELSDFAGFRAGSIALIQRGTCSYDKKVYNALLSSAAGVLIFNEGQPPDRTGVVVGSADSLGNAMPIFGISYALGEELAGLIENTPSGVRMHMEAHVDLVNRPTYSLLADTPAGNNRRAIVVGGHLDSVPFGPGINDNGSGAATILELALQMARLEIAPKNTVRFAFWGGEERGLAGAGHYVRKLDAAARDDIWMNLNFDMIGSPNFARFVFDGDGSSMPLTGPTGLAGPTGSAEIELLFERYFDSQALPFEPTAFDGRSDYLPFITLGIPAGGLFTGAEVQKSEAQVALYGGTAGEAFDRCYHRACDTIENIHFGVLGEMSDAVAELVFQYAMDDRSVMDRPRGSTLTGSVDSHYQLDFKGAEVPVR